jgi:hypothetical protein
MVMGAALPLVMRAGGWAGSAGAWPRSRLDVVVPTAGMVAVGTRFGSRVWCG